MNPARGLAACVLVAVVLAAGAPAPVRGQHEGPDAPGHLALLSANAMVGAVSAGLVAWARGEDVSRAFLLGAGGGSIGYAGKVVVTARFSGAAIVGRQVAGLGHSIIGSAAAGRAPLSEVWLPLSPLRVRLPLGGSPWGLQVDLGDVTGLLYGVLTPALDFDPELTLGYGTPVFVATGRYIRLGDDYLGGVALPGTILLSGDVGTGRERHSILAHEMVHIVQHDFARVAISYPIERWALGLLAPGWDAAGAVQGGLFAPAVDLLAGGMRNDRVLQELIEGEARALVRVFRPTGPRE